MRWRAVAQQCGGPNFGSVTASERAANTIPEIAMLGEQSAAARGEGGHGGGRRDAHAPRAHLFLIEIGDELVLLPVELLEVRVVPVLRLHLAATSTNRAQSRRFCSQTKSVCRLVAVAYKSCSALESKQIAPMTGILLKPTIFVFTCVLVCTQKHAAPDQIE